MSWSPRTLRGQLAVLFLALTLIPSLLVTAVATHRLFGALARWENPGLREALDGSLEVAKDLVDRTQNDLRQRGQLLAADPALSPPLDPETLRERLAGAYNLDFLQLYDDQGTLILEVTRDPLLPTLGPVPRLRDRARMASPFEQDRNRFLLSYSGLMGAPGEPEQVLVTGIYLDDDFYIRIDNLSKAVIYYHNLPTLISLQQRVVLLVLGIAVLALGAAAVWIARRLSTRVTRPVRALGQGMERVAQGEDAVAVQPQGPQEMEQLIRRFNTMSTDLSRSRRALARAERLTAWRDIARRVAHEMKNALTPVTFAAHRLRKLTPELDDAVRPKVERAVETVQEEVEGLRRLAASFSELARLPVPEFAPVNLGDLLGGVAGGFQGGPATVEWTPPPEPLMIEGDRTLLRQTVTNLIKNAREALGEEKGEAGRVWVRARAEGDLARVVIEDNGPGWPEGLGDQVLDPYTTTKEQGSGLGLSIVQRTLLQHGGALHLEQRPEGGARVVLELPRIPGAANAGGRQEAS